MKDNDEVLENFEEYRCLVQNLHKKKIKVFKSDDGREFRNKIFDKYLAVHGI